MALTQFAFCEIGDLGTGSIIPAMIGSTIVSEVLTPGVGSLQTAVAPRTGKRCGLRIATDTACYIAVGEDPDATNVATRFYMPANSVEYVMVDAGHRAAVVAA